MTRVRDLLGPNGPLARSLDGYEDRPGQLAMAEAVERALDEDRVLLCEAGTGTGKTFAYLVPAILSGRKVVISTATKALQDQIFEKDLPLVRKLLGLEVHAVRVKGLANYLCLRRYAELRQSGDVFRPEIARSLPLVENWARRTQTGDVAELSGFSEDNPLWREINSSSDTRIGSACDKFDECFITNLRREAAKAQILIVNHHLFFADLAVKGPHSGGALPDYDAVVFDEAHQLEEVATQFFGVRVSSAQIEAMLRDAERTLVSEGLQRKKKETHPNVLAVREASQRFFGALAEKYETIEGRAPFDPTSFDEEMKLHVQKVDAALEALGAFAETQKASEAVELIARRTNQIREDLASVLEGAQGQVTWIEVRSRSAAIGASPISTSGILRTKVFERVPAVVLTSATLATHAGFAFLRSRLGIEEAEDRPVDELVVPSPFEFEERSLLYVPADLPDPREHAWLDAAKERALELVRATGGGAFVLCTSTRVMRAMHAALAEAKVPGLMMQGEAPKGLLLSRFREEKNAVLVATMSFWEGVDVPGRALRMVVLDKIPFAVPTDPVVLARTAAIERQGENAFARYHLPVAAMTLKQGFGRLLRTKGDAGVVAILDPRIRRMGYGRMLTNSLPPARKTDRIEVVRAFIERMDLGGDGSGRS